MYMYIYMYPFYPLVHQWTLRLLHMLALSPSFFWGP